MTDDKALGLVLGSALAPESMAPVAAAAGELGFDELWFSEDCFFTGGISGAAIALASTAHVRVGLGVASAMLRHPALLSMEVATLARCFPGRLAAGVGLGVPGWLRQLERMPASPLTALRECVTSLRRLLDGERLDERGDYFAFHGVELAHPVPGAVPIYLGVVGRRMLQLSGEVADGSILSVCAGTEYLRWAREQVAIGRALPGARQGAHRVTAFSLYAVDEDRDAAHAAMRAPLAFYLAADGQNDLTRTAGVAEAIVEMAARGGAGTVAAEMPGEWVERLSVCGTPEDCAGRIAELYEAGADSVALFPVAGDRLLEVAALTAAKVAPLLEAAR